MKHYYFVILFNVGHHIILVNNHKNTKIIIAEYLLWIYGYMSWNLFI